MENVIIIGTGCAGYTAAIYTARANLSPLLLSGSQLGGQLTTTTEVENFPGHPEGIMGPDLMMKMQAQAEKFGARIAWASVEAVTRQEDGTFLLKAGEQSFTAKAVIVATGAAPRHLGLTGEQHLIGHGLTSCATCDGAFYRDVPVCVIGGGDSACEEADFLTRFASKVYLIHRRDTLRASKIMADRTLANPKIEPVWNSTVSEYLTDDKGEVRAVTVRNLVTGAESELALSCVTSWTRMRTVTSCRLRAALPPKRQAFLPLVMWRTTTIDKPSPPPAKAAPPPWKQSATSAATRKGRCRAVRYDLKDHQEPVGGASHSPHPQRELH